MALEDLTLIEYLQIIYRRKRIIFVVIFLSTIITIITVWRQQPVYTAKSRIKIQRQQTFADLMGNLQKLQPINSIDNYLREMTSYQFLLRVARKLYPQSEQLDQVVARFQEITTVTHLENTDLIDIQTTSESKNEAIEVANAIASTFIQYHQENITQTSRQIKESIEEWRNQIMAQLTSDERSLKDFQSQFGVIDTKEEGKMLMDSIRQMEQKITELNNREVELNSRIRELEDLFTQLNKGLILEVNTADSPYMTGIKSKIFELEMRRSELVKSGNYTTNHPQVIQLETMIKEAKGLRDSEQKKIIKFQIANMVNEKAGVLAIKKECLKQIEVAKQRLTELPEIDRMYRKYSRSKEISEQLYSFLSQRLEEARIAELEKSEIAMIISPAISATEIEATKVRSLIAGILLGILLGIALAFIAENLDTSIATITTIEQVFHLPVLGVVPHIIGESERAVTGPAAIPTVWERLNEKPYIRQLLSIFQKSYDYLLASHANLRSEWGVVLITQMDPKSPGAEAYRTIRTNIEYYSQQAQAKVLLISSPGPTEGKSITLTNTAMALAQLGRKVLIIGANLRRPSIGRIFGIPEEKGLSDILLGNSKWTEVIKDMTDIAVGSLPADRVVGMPGIDNLQIITSGGVASQPSEWLASAAMRNFLKEAREKYDYVLVDAPPILPVPDSAILGSVVDGVIMVYKLGSTTRESMRRAITTLIQTNAKLIGIVLNDLKADWAAGGEFFHYRLFYGRQETGKKKPHL